MAEYFVIADSFAAPFFSDRSEAYVLGDDPHKTLQHYVDQYSHPAGLYAATIYASADAYHKDREPLAQWLSNHELGKREATKDRAGYSYLGHGPGDFEVSGDRVKIADPKGGRIVA